jgi:hypothetical protein
MAAVSFSLSAASPVKTVSVGLSDPSTLAVDGNCIHFGQLSGGS